jgi:hypothetical protein
MLSTLNVFLTEINIFLPSLPVPAYGLWLGPQIMSRPKVKYVCYG